MAEFEPKDYWKVYLDKETKQKIREIQDHLKSNYQGKTDFVQQKIQEEQALDIEERIKRKKQKKESVEQDLEKLKRIKEEREQQDKLRDKKELLKEKQKKLKKYREERDEEPKSREEIFEEVVNEQWQSYKASPAYNKTGGFDTREEYVEAKKQRLNQQVDRKLKKQNESVDVDSLVEDVQRLQQQVKELNGGRENWFMSLQTVQEVEN